MACPLARHVNGRFVLGSVALAHRHTAISLMPGGKVLDIITHKKLTN